MRTLLVRGLGFFAVVLTGAFVTFYSQASSPNYRNLWWLVFPFIVVHVVMLTLFIVRVPHFSRWLAALIGGVAVLSFVELSLRVWL
jgi:hypothetical protein